MCAKNPTHCAIFRLSLNSSFLDPGASPERREQPVWPGKMKQPGTAGQKCPGHVGHLQIYSLQIKVAALNKVMFSRLCLKTHLYFLVAKCGKHTYVAHMAPVKETALLQHFDSQKPGVRCESAAKKLSEACKESCELCSHRIFSCPEPFSSTNSY